MIVRELPVLGRYRLLAEIGRGGMAEVYLAVAQGPAGFTKLVVVKQLRDALCDDPDFLEMFLAEARLAARLNHPHVVQTIEVSTDRGHHFIVMEFLDGQPLHRVLSRAALSMTAQLRIICDALSGLHHAHELTDYDGTPLGIVHRDVSPHNVIVTYDGAVKLVDFGIAKAHDSTETKAGILKGKIVYMAPEQARGERVDRRADLFSVGMMLFEIVAGRRMWKGLSDLTVLPRLIRGEVQDLAEAAPTAPERLVAIVRRALALDPGARHPTALAMQRELEAAIAALGGAPPGDEIGARVAQSFAEPRARAKSIIDEQLRRARSPVDSGSFAIPAVDLEPASVVSESEITQPSTPRARRKSERPSQPSQATRGAALVMERPPEPMPRTAFPVRGAVIAAAFAAVLVALGGGAYFGARPTSSPTAAASSTATMQPMAVPMASGCSAEVKPLVEISGEIDGDFTLRCENDYQLKFTTFVRPGATLTIEPGTTLRGDKATMGTLVVQAGGRIVARGTRDRPIVFTSMQPKADRRPGDWGGVILLGRAPINLRGADGKPAKGRVEGITHGGAYGGDDPNDDSGVLEYVRIEYSGVAIGPNNEINGLTLAGVGRGTKIDHVMVRQTADDCFEFFGGTVDAKHLICQYNGDDGFDWDYGYQGRLQFLYLQQDPNVVDDTNGLEGDNDPNGTANGPVSNPTIYNVTLCGMRKDPAKEQYGMLLRRGTRGRIANAIVTGFETGLDLRDGKTLVDLRSTIFFGHVTHPIAHPEGTGANRDDDEGFDEIAFFLDPARRNAVIDPELVDCFDPEEPRPWPKHALVDRAAEPPKDGFFDAKARYVGAFRDQSDDWMAGAWAQWGAR